MLHQYTYLQGNEPKTDSETGFQHVLVAINNYDLISNIKPRALFCSYYCCERPEVRLQIPDDVPEYRGLSQMYSYPFMCETCKQMFSSEMELTPGNCDRWKHHYASKPLRQRPWSNEINCGIWWMKEKAEAELEMQSAIVEFANRVV